MKILLYDKMQIATVPDEVKSPALSDVYDESNVISPEGLGGERINCMGVGYTDATIVTISNGLLSYSVQITRPAPYHNGLYLIDEMYGDEYGASFVITHNGTFIGRVGIGEYRTLGTSPTKEIGFYSTNENRETLQGQKIPGAGGYTGRRFTGDVRYKIDAEIYNDIELAYPLQIGKEFPFFMMLDDERHKVPFNMYRFYGYDKPISMLQSDCYQFLYSNKFNFYEAF